MDFGGLSVIAVLIIAVIIVTAYFIGKKKGLDMKALYGKWFSQLLGERGVKEMFKSPFLYCLFCIEFLPGIITVVYNTFINSYSYYYHYYNFTVSNLSSLLGYDLAGAFLIWLVLGCVAGFLAKRKGYSFLKYFGISFIITPILSLYAVKRLQITPEAERLAEEQAQQEAQQKLRQAEEAAEAERLQRIMPKQSSGCLSKILLLILVIVGLGFGYKKLITDYDGTYATQRLTYTDEYGICLLVSYHPQYRTGNSNGFAIVHIPFKALLDFEEISKTRKDCDDEDMYTSYQMLAKYGDNAIVDSLAKLFSDEIKMSTRPYQIGNKGNYFILQASDVGLKTY